MSSFNQGPQGGGGVRQGGARPPGGGGGFGGGGSGGGQPQRPERTVAELWPDYLKDGYFDAGNLRIEYVSRHIEGNEKVGVEPLVRAMAGDRTPLTTGQLRRFFQHCRALEARLKSRQATWPQVRDRFVFLDSAAQDAYGKDDPKIPGLFYDFIRRNVAAVRTDKDFLGGFLPHFEAVVGFGSRHVRR